MRRTFTHVTLTLIAFNTVVAISVVAFGDMSGPGGKVLLTSLLATGAALLAIVQLPALHTRRLGMAPLLGVASAAVGFLVTAAALWSETTVGAWWKLGASGYVIASGAAIAAILSAWHVTGRARWLNHAAPTLLGVGTLMILVGIWLEIDDDGYWRLFAIIAVLVAALGLAIPILYRSLAQPRATTHCPFCGALARGRTDRVVTCADCNMSFRVAIVR